MKREDIEKEKRMFEDAQVGDRVWCFIRGWGTISKIDYNIDYPIYVEFDDGNTGYSFTYKGILNARDKNPILFWNEIKFDIPEKPFDLESELRKLEITEFRHGKNNNFLVWSNEFKHIDFYYFNSFQNPSIICFTKESICNFMKVIKNKNITKEQFFKAYERVFKQGGII